jgi:hypothetical protein
MRAIMIYEIGNVLSVLFFSLAVWILERYVFRVR